MDFWAAQRRARSKTKIYVSAFIALTVAVSLFVEWALRTYSDGSYDPPFPFFGALFLATTFLVAGFNYKMYQAFGGSYVAKSVGAYEVKKNSLVPEERQLLNIVEEMALAASLPVPPVFIIPVNEINAFAAGITPSNAAIAITEGALRRLSRQEVQGVIAHEFGHIYNGDMKISMRLAAMVMGFFFILYFGFRILQVTGIGYQRRVESSKERGGNPIALAAVIFIMAGAFTYFFGSILKATVSREREYLADACAVQFTRSTEGIANALRKIAKDTIYDMPGQGSAYSHLYFQDHSFLSSLFATHPPIQKRIAAIEGGLYEMDPGEAPKKPPSL